MAGFKYLLVVLALSAFGEGSRILVLFPFPSKSHSILGEGVAKLLLDAGHEVTYITTHPKKDSHPMLHQVDISDNVKAFPNNMANLRAIMDKDVPKNDINAFFSILVNLSKVTLSNENVQKLINDDSQKFDLVIIEWMFSEVYAGLSVIYECPFIWFSSVDPHWVVLSLIDEALNPAYNPDSISNNMPPFTFRQRVVELFSQIFVALFRNFYLVPADVQEYEKIFAPIMVRKGKSLPSFHEVRYNASLMLGNSHVSIGSATRLPQNYKPIAGYHIDPNTSMKPLPEDLKEIMDRAKNGVIYFSMGSNLKSKELPDNLKRELLNMFGGLKYTVIWKFEEALSDVPNNVHILQWAPQPQILSHPNCILFLTHGGLLSIIETVHFGVPIIGIPVLADQGSNVLKAVHRGIAKKVELSYSIADDLQNAIREILGDPKYKEKVKELSLIYHDRPLTPGKELVHSVGHVMRTGGALHLRSPALLVPWYQKMYIDFLALVIAVSYVVQYAVKKFLSRLLTTMISKNVNQANKSNKKKNN